jgi:hypothetical protein
VTRRVTRRVTVRVSLVTHLDSAARNIRLSSIHTRIASPSLTAVATHPISILATLQYDSNYWQSKFSKDELKAINLEAKLHLVFSLMVFLSISTRQLLHWLFTTEIPTVTIRISHFMGFFTSESTAEARFGPAMVFSLWRNKTRYPAAQKHLREMTIPCAHELALQDSDRVISSPLLSIRLKTLTIRQLREMLHPQKLIEIMEGLAPFTWGILHTFCASPNASRKRKKAEEDEPMPVGEEDWEDDPNDDPDLESGEADPGSSAGRSWTRDYPGFSRNPIFVRIFSTL